MQVVTRPAVGFTVAQDADLLGDLWLYMRWCEAWDDFMSHLKPNTKTAYLRDWDDLIAWKGGVDWRQPVAITLAAINHLQAEGRSAEHIATLYQQQFSAMRGLPWTIYEEDITRWLESMRHRRINRFGKLEPPSKATLIRAVASISAFFNRVADHDVRWPDGHVSPLSLYNPVRKHHRSDIDGMDEIKVKRTAYPLSGNQVNELLAAIPIHTVTGKRDFAMFSFYLNSGRRNSEIRLLRWGDLHFDGKKVHYTWTGKHQAAAKREAMAPNVWAAIKEYLKAADRFDNMQPGDYLFTADFEYFDRHNNVGNICGQETDTTGLIEYTGEIGNLLNRPLGMRYVEKKLKHYAAAIGLDPKQIWPHLLRHTFSHTHQKVGTKESEIQRLLNHKNLSTTDTYLKDLSGNSELVQTYRMVEEQYRLPELMDQRGISAA